MALDKKRKSLSKIIRNKIIEYIEKNNLKPGDQLPSEPKLVKKFGVSRITVREALAQFKQEGIIYKVQGKGTFLKRSPVHMENGLEILKSPTEIMKAAGYEIKTIHFPGSPQKPSPDIKENLDLAKDEKIITYKRKRYADQKLVVYGEDSLSVNNFPDKVPEKIPQESMLNFLEDDLNIKIERAFTEVIPTTLGKKLSELLEVKKDKIFLLLKQIHYNDKGEAKIFSLDYFNSEAFKFVINRKKFN
ncbi:MAG: GntR family transcriptional regulator [Bacillota bacterium]